MWGVCGVCVRGVWRVCAGRVCWSCGVCVLVVWRVCAGRVCWSCGVCVLVVWRVCAGRVGWGGGWGGVVCVWCVCVPCCGLWMCVSVYERESEKKSERERSAA